jgi:ankyrin repeat protein
VLYGLIDKLKIEKRKIKMAYSRLNYFKKMTDGLSRIKHPMEIQLKPRKPEQLKSNYRVPVIGLHSAPFIHQMMAGSPLNQRHHLSYQSHSNKRKHDHRSREYSSFSESNFFKKSFLMPGAGIVALTTLNLAFATAADNDDEKNAQLLNACKRGDLDTVKRLISEGAKIDAKDSEGNTALLLAAKGDHLELVKWLLLKEGGGGAKITQKNNQNETALLLASKEGHLELVKWLLLKEGGGAGINEKDMEGHTAFLLAAKKGHFKLVKWLLEEGWADINEQNNSDSNALLLVLSFELDIREIEEKMNNDQLIEVDVINLKDEGDRLRLLAYLIDNKVNILKPNEFGWTALHFAVYFEDLAAINILLQNNAKIDAKTDSGKKPVDVIKVKENNVESLIMRSTRKKEKKTISSFFPSWMFGIAEQPDLIKEIKKRRAVLGFIRMTLEEKQNFMNVQQEFQKLKLEKERMNLVIQEKREFLHSVEKKINSQKEKDIHSAIDNFRKILNEKLNVSIFADKAIWDGVVRTNATTMDKLLEMGHLATTLSDDVNLRIIATLGKILLQQDLEQYKREKASYIEKFSNINISEATRAASFFVAKRYRDQLLELTSEGMESFAQYFHDKLMIGLRKNYKKEVSNWNFFSCNKAYTNSDSYSWSLVRAGCWLTGNTGKKGSIEGEMFRIMIACGGSSTHLQLRGKDKKEINIDSKTSWDARDLVNDVGVLVEDERTVLSEEKPLNSDKKLYYIERKEKPPKDESSPKYNNCYGGTRRTSDTSNMDLHKPDDHLIYVLNQENSDLNVVGDEIILVFDPKLLEKKGYKDEKLKKLMSAVFEDILGKKIDSACEKFDDQISCDTYDRCCMDFNSEGSIKINIATENVDMRAVIIHKIEDIKIGKQIEKEAGKKEAEPALGLRR